MTQGVSSPIATYAQQSDCGRCTTNPPESHTLARSDTLRHAAKFLIDSIGSFVLILLLSPLFALLTALIRLESKGPILFRQKRMGRDGRIFSCLKFRTMVVDAESMLKDLEHLNESSGGVLFKIKRDPRITKVGSILRRSSLDELPQLFNIFMGQMSLVGPRPLPLRDCERLEKLDPLGYRLRLSRPQGITGHWQVNGRSDVSPERMLELDMYYVNNWSLSLDLKILLRTVLVVFTCRGAC